MRHFGYNRHAGNAGDAEGVQIVDFSRDPGTRSVVGVYFGHNDATELRARVPFLLT